MELSAANRLQNFLDGVAAAVQLFNRADEEGFFIEYICLATSIIDAQLRIGLILRNQIDNANKDVPEEYIFQREAGPIFSEKTIYRKSLAKGIINQKTFDTLIKYYNDRNRVIHRYIISEITTEQVAKIARRYQDIMIKIEINIDGLEMEQIEKGVELTIRRPGILDMKAIKRIRSMMKRKHSNIDLSSGIHRLPTK